jgi:hypothetical protein
MQMSQASTDIINMEQNNKIYLLTIIIKGELMAFTLTNPKDILFPSYSRKMTLKEIKEMHKIFSLLKSCNDFLVFLKDFSKNKKLSIVKKGDQLCINFIIEDSLKKQLVEISLTQDNTTFESILVKEITVLKEKMNNLEKENMSLKQEIKDLKILIEPMVNKFKERVFANKHLFNNNSSILKGSEFDMIHFAIKSRLDKQVKEVKKLYQATIDGDGPINFHTKCDNIPNTLTIIKSAGNRRFGGFTTQTWDSSEKYKDDKSAFVFSLDKQKIYSYKNNGKAIYCKKDGGPIFGQARDINIGINPIQMKTLYTNESSSLYCSYDYEGDNNALSEDGKASSIYAVEYEVFQIIFS